MELTPRKRLGTKKTEELDLEHGLDLTDVYEDD